MDDAYRHNVRRTRQLLYLLHELDLMTNVEEREWFVKKQVTT